MFRYRWIHCCGASGKARGEHVVSTLPLTGDRTARRALAARGNHAAPHSRTTRRTEPGLGCFLCKPPNARQRHHFASRAQPGATRRPTPTPGALGSVR